jgi:hypothetical protein
LPGCQLINQLNPPLVSAAIEAGCEPGVNDGPRLGLGNEPLSERQNVRVVVSAR